MRTHLFARLGLLLIIGTVMGDARVLAQTKSGELFFEQVAQQFAHWDKDTNSVLSTNELDLAVADTQVTGKNAAAVAALKRALRSTRYQLPLLTLESIHTLATNTPATNRPNLGRMFTEGLRQITNAPLRNLFGSGLPRLETIHQGKLGNCFTLAPLGAMVHRDPQQVVRMFTALDDGAYRVTLGQQAVVVSPPTDAELAMTASNEQGGIWVNLYEKAVGQTRNESKPVEEQAGSAIDALARGGSAGTMLAFITGHEMVRFSFKFAKEPATNSTERDAKLVELREKLNAAVVEKRLMTCGTLKTTTPGVTPNHAYAVLGFDAASDQVKLWNPHGDDFLPKGEVGPVNGYPRQDGIFQLPLREFVQQFSGMAFEVSTSLPAGI